MRVIRAFGAYKMLEIPSISRRRFGVPIGGPSDALSAQLVSALLVGGGGMTLIECFGAIELEDDRTDYRVAIVGKLDSVELDGKSHAANASYTLPRGCALRVSAERAWGSVLIGFQPVNPGFSNLRTARLASPVHFAETGPIRVQPGLDGVSQAHLFNQEFEVDIRSDRRGIRLVGNLREVQPLNSSIPITPGVIQLPPAGSPIIVGPDGPTIGGYPIIGVVAQVDLPRLPYLPPKSIVRFESIDFDQARALKAAQDLAFCKLIAEIKIAVQP